MSGPGLFLTQSGFGKTQPNVIDLTFAISGAVTSALVPPSATAVRSFYGAQTQAQIDAFLGTVLEFTAAQFDSTSMGADAFGVLLNMNGQAAQVVRAEAMCYSGTGGSTLVPRVAQGAAGLTASTLETACAVGANGNIGVKVDFGNTPDFDALTAGTIVIRVYWIAK